MEVSWAYVKRLAQRSEKIGFDLTLIAELNLNDIKCAEAPSLMHGHAAALARNRANRIDGGGAADFSSARAAREQAANIDQISNGRLTLNVVSSWWADEARKYGVTFEQHDDRYARTSEWLDVLDGVWKQDHFSYSGSITMWKTMSSSQSLLRSRGQRFMRRRVSRGKRADRREV